MTITALIELLQKHASSDGEVFIEQDNGDGFQPYPIEGILIHLDAEGKTTGVVLG